MASSFTDLSPPQTANLLTWLRELYKRLGSGKGPFPIKGYAVAALPSATIWGDTSSFSSLIYVYNETGGAVLAFSDGTNWRRVTDRAIVA
jgi:hypothetical protein